ncbi:Bug family tripartite tricarboxylate transporter substrate binding protein [Falsiroseomonas stagni]|uniref:Tripartite tricarboxylate transporter family receptor n=1 Tax=Falsiroseomonas stagni DSM 19981 TaxID=1123062 RepID=A0A1I4BAP8_9PROT|nr:tripartite tricarboxylate transporter substrate-binding protein [Falsiroseomonas stagni]SFK65046.1 Tripartite tricarboxylate transporter family receptor [Falsiroseomonas stagni DSM 19981]
MRFPRRNLLLGAPALLWRPAAAQDGFPNRPIRIVVPFTPGGITDILARAMAEMRALANTAATRSPLLPAVPTIRESGFDCVMEGWNAIFAPLGTPEAVVAQLNATIRGIIARPAIQARLLELGVAPRANAPGEMAALLRDDIALWNGVIDRAGIERQ